MSSLQPIAALAHADPAWPQSFIVKLAECGRLIAIGHDAFKATAKRLAEEGHDPKTKLTVHFVDGRPSIEGKVSDGLAA
ncbi:hypothetical protein [Bradyrhizobium genomosp. III]|uniref:hypothetical protein n=1 Tax=Bradyrhizobium genomosp. III TaxID=2683271 RepID=UPI00057666A6|nr:hypothetical protein [Bradyrhizobium sp. CCBAU 15544]